MYMLQTRRRELWQSVAAMEWNEHNVIAKSRAWVHACRRPEKTLMSAYGLCQQMMHVFHQFRLYVTFEVMEPAWIGMQSSLDKAHTLDEVSAVHAVLYNKSCATF